MNLIFPKYNRLRALFSFILLIVILFLFLNSNIFISKEINPKIIPPKKTESQDKFNTFINKPEEKIKNILPKIHSETDNEADKPKQDFIRKMMLHAWNGYKKKAWGCHEVRTDTGDCHNPSYLGAISGLGTTIVDAIDTLYIMKLNDEVSEAREFIKNLDFQKQIEVSLFEYNIRFLGGFLTMYSFTQDEIYLEKAKQLADILSSAFNTKTGFPYSLINLKTKKAHAHSWAPGRCAIAAEFGTLQMEWAYLSELTNNSSYSDKVKKIRESIVNLEKLNNGLFYNYYDNRKGTTCSKSSSFGALGDSLYEYLLKEDIRSNNQDSIGRGLYDKAIQTMIETGLYATSERSKSNYIANYEFGSNTKFMEHLACFVGGLLMLGTNGDQKNINFQRGLNITSTCHRSYASSAIGLGPDTFYFTDSLEAVANINSNKKYLLRPETVESYFYAWRYTKDPKYREWAWDCVQALEKYTKGGYGYSGIENVYESDPRQDNVQQSFFLAETLKYLYLIFSDENTISLKHWIFNTEAHPLPIKNK